MLERIDAVTYIVSGDPLAQRAWTNFIGRAFVVDVPEGFEPDEVWAVGPLRPHARSAYKAANYRRARRYRSWTQMAGDVVGDAVGGVADLYGEAMDAFTEQFH